MTSTKPRKGGRGFSPLGAIIEEAIRELGLGEAVAKGAAMHLWPEVVGDTVARVTRPETVRGRTLVVAVTDSAWLQQLRYMEEAVVQKLNAAVGEPVIEGLYFKLGPIPPRPEDEAEADLGEEPLDAETAAHIERVVAGLADPELRATLKQILTASRRLKEGDPL